MGQGDPGVEAETARAIQKSPMYQCLGTTANLEGSSPEASQIKRQKIIGFTYVSIWCNFFKELSKESTRKYPGITSREVTDPVNIW